MVMYPLLIALGLYAAPMLAANQVDELVQFAQERKEYYRKKYPTMTDRVLGARVAQDVEKRRFGVKKSAKAQQDHNINAVIFPEYDINFADQYSKQEDFASPQKQPKMVDVAAGVQEAESVLEGLQPEQQQEQYADNVAQEDAQEIVARAYDKYDAVQAQQQQEQLEQMNNNAVQERVRALEQENNATRQQQEQEEQALADYNREQQAHAINASIDAAHDEYKPSVQKDFSMPASATIPNVVKPEPARYEVVVHQPQQSGQAVTATTQGQHVHIAVADSALQTQNSSVTTKPAHGTGKIRVNNYPVVRINEPVDIEIDAHEGTVNYHVVGKDGMFKSYLAAYLQAYKDRPKTTLAKTAAAMGLGSLMVYGMYKAGKWLYKNYWHSIAGRLQGKPSNKPAKPQVVNLKNAR